MEKVKQKIHALQENIDRAKEKRDKCKLEVQAKVEKIEKLSENIKDQKASLETAEDDLETSEEELIGLKSERKKLIDDEEEIERNLRKIMRSKDQSQVGTSGLQTKIMNNKDKLAELLAEIADRENSINMYEQDLDTAEENNNMLKDQLAELNTDLADATAIRQSISSSRMTITGAGGNLRNQVSQRADTLTKRKKEHEIIEEQVETLLCTRDQLECDIEKATNKLEEAKLESAQLLEELENL
ncbi:hypothetical protein LOD99_3724 [Oopsacas minuta]|uniref:Tropomyosin n=1 Tax=Oopsacas minuta TaxID=111878 RepID=A0AAV7JXH6_9METZ|nr:hypothetical protein LOD99_3724 [Oopsacas minuta]